MKKMNLKDMKRKCSKCGSSPADDPSVQLHRFPQPTKANKSRCELWAKFCFPDMEWKSPDFHNKLFTDHKMLCDKHFKSTSFMKEKRLPKFSVPDKESSDPDHVVIKSEPEFDHLNQDTSISVEMDHIETRQQEIRRVSQQIKATIDNRQTKQISKQNTPVNTPAKKNNKQKESGKIITTENLLKKIDDTWANDTENITQEDFNEWFNKTSKYDDCELYGKLLTKKLRTYEVFERNQLMFKIDGLLIEHPPGFDTTSHSYTIASTEQIVKRVANKNKQNQSSETILEYDNNDDSDDDSSLSSQPKRLKKDSQSKSTIASQVSSTSSISPHIIITTSNQPVTTTPTKLPTNKSSITNLPVKKTNVVQQLVKAKRTVNQVVNVTTNIPNELVKVKSAITQPFKITSNTKQQPIKATSSIPNKPVKVLSISNQASDTVPSHLPLHITIPQNKLASHSPSKVPYTSQPKGKIVILKSKSTKYVPSSQPPILITVPTISTSRSPCNKNSLEQLSSIAVRHASQYKSYPEGAMEEDMNVVSHEEVYEDDANQNIMETALRYANIEEELSSIGC